MDFHESTHLIEKGSVNECQVYKKRWLMLLIFTLFGLSNLVNINEYVSIAESLVNYYDISTEDIDWSSLITQVLYVPALIPSTYALFKLGLRKAILWSLVITSIGNAVKIIGVAPDKYWAIFLGQCIIAFPQALVLPMCAQVAATWFGDNQVGTACGLGILAFSFSLGLGLLLPPLVVNSENNALIREGLYAISIGYAAFPIILLFVTYFYFSDAPPKPPSTAQLKLQNNTFPTRNYLQSLKELVGNRSFLLLKFSYAINFGSFYAFNTLLNQLLLKYHPGAITDVGIIGFLIDFVGSWGSLLVGANLDKFRQYKVTFWIINILNFGSTIAVYLLINQPMYVVYITAILYGFCTNAILSVSIELGVELTYPVSQSIMTSIFTVAAQLLCPCFTLSYSYLMRTFGDATAHIALCGIQIFGVFLIYFIKFDLKRQTALSSGYIMSNGNSGNTQ